MRFKDASRSTIIEESNASSKRSKQQRTDDDEWCCGFENDYLFLLWRFEGQEKEREIRDKAFWMSECSKIQKSSDKIGCALSRQARGPIPTRFENETRKMDMTPRTICCLLVSKSSKHPTQRWTNRQNKLIFWGIFIFIYEYNYYTSVTVSVDFLIIKYTARWAGEHLHITSCYSCIKWDSKS